jgi:hypothetical protein
MTTVSVLASPPDESSAVERLAGGPLDRAAATRLYEAMFADVCRAIERSGADLVVAISTEEDASRANGEFEDLLAENLTTPEAVEAVIRDGCDRTEAITGEVLRLHEAGVTSAAIVEPTAPFLARTNVDGAAMKLRSSEVVLGPGPGGRVYFAGFGEPIDLRDHLGPPAIEGLAGLANADRAVDFIPMQPIVEDAKDLPSAVAYLRARVAAGRRVPERTASVVADLGLAVHERDGSLVLAAEDGA